MNVHYETQGANSGETNIARSAAERGSMVETSRPICAHNSEHTSPNPMVRLASPMPSDSVDEEDRRAMRQNMAPCDSRLEVARGDNQDDNIFLNSMPFGTETHPNTVRTTTNFPPGWGTAVDTTAATYPMYCPTNITYWTVFTSSNFRAFASSFRAAKQQNRMLDRNQYMTEDVKLDLALQIRTLNIEDWESIHTWGDDRFFETVGRIMTGIITTTPEKRIMQYNFHFDASSRRPVQQFMHFIRDTLQGLVNTDPLRFVSVTGPRERQREQNFVNLLLTKIDTTTDLGRDIKASMLSPGPPITVVQFMTRLHDITTEFVIRRNEDSRYGWVTVPKGDPNSKRKWAKSNKYKANSSPSSSDDNNNKKRKQ